MEAKLSDEQLSQVTEFVARTMGLHFPPQRWPDLQRGVTATAKALGFEEAADFVQRLASTSLSKRELEILASNLTVGETYFFRDSRVFDSLATHILPPLIRQRQSADRRLRIWSAACCTGEEPYSIAILLQRLIPDWRSWNLTILATDINADFLRRAETGIYGQWSFRDVPPWLKQQYFCPVANGQLEILPEVRQMVRFAHLNLVDDVYPALANDTNALDVIFCRNVLMYFTPDHAKKVLHNLYRAQVEGGWLIVSGSELMLASGGPYASVNVSDTTLFRKDSRKSQQVSEIRQPAPTDKLFIDQPLPQPVAKAEPPAPFVRVEPVQPPVEVVQETQGAVQISYADAVSLYEQGRYRDVVDRLRSLASGSEEPDILALLTRSLANLGELAQALACCEQWAAADKLNPSAHYLRAILLQEQNELGQAANALRTALYVDPGFPLAHFAMANLARRSGDFPRAGKYLKNAQQALRDYEPQEILPESDGITAGRLAEIIATLMNVESAA